MNEVTRDEIERFYEKAAAAGVHAPLEPGELDSMEDRLAGRVIWRQEPDRHAVRHINLTADWLGVVVTAGAWLGHQVPVLAGEYRVVRFGSTQFVVAHQLWGEVALVHSL